MNCLIYRRIEISAAKYLSCYLMQPVIIIKLFAKCPPELHHQIMTIELIIIIKHESEMIYVNLVPESHVNDVAKIQLATVPVL